MEDAGTTVTSSDTTAFQDITDPETTGTVRTNTVEEPAKSVAFLEFERSLKKTFSTIFNLTDGTSFKEAIIAHFHASGINQRAQAPGHAYKFVNSLAHMETWQQVREMWRALLQLQDLDQTPNTTILPETILPAMRSLCQRLIRLGRTDISIYRQMIIYWDDIYQLESDKQAFRQELDQYATVTEKLDKVNEQIRLLDLGKELRVTAQGRSIDTHVQYLFDIASTKYGFGKQTGLKSRSRQAIFIKAIMSSFGRGAFAILALDGYKTSAQYVQTETLKTLAAFMQETTMIQKLFNHLEEFLVSPILAGDRVSEFGAGRLNDVFTSAIGVGIALVLLSI